MARLVSSVIFLTAVSLSLTLDAADPLRYHWEAKQKFIYRVDIKADLPSKMETLSGHISYEVKSADSPLKITYRGGLSKKSTNKPGKSSSRVGAPFGPFGPGFGPGFRGPPSPFSRPVNPFKGLETTSNEIVMSNQGSVATLTGSSQLPYLLGNLSLLVFEPLPDEDEASWSVDTSVLIREKKEQARGFGPFGDPFFARRFGADKPEKSTAGGVSMLFSERKVNGPLVSFKKTYRLHSPGDDATLTVEGDGLWVFNQQLGMSESMQLKQRLTIKQENVSVVLPFEINYRRLSRAEWAKIEADRLAAEKARTEKLKEMAAAAKAKADAAIEGDERRSVLATLEGDNAVELSSILKALAAKTPRSDEELAAAIQPHVESGAKGVGDVAKKALAAFSPEFKRVYDVNAAYRGNRSVSQLGLWVSHETPLPTGLLVAANRSHREETYYPAKVVALISNGLVKVRYVGWGSRTEERLREDIFLAPDEVEQPDLNEKQRAQMETYGERVRQSLGANAEDAKRLEELIRAYRDNKKPLPKVGGEIPKSVKLPKYVVVAGQKKDGKWYQAHVSSELPDGRVAVRFSGDVWDAKLTRAQLRLPPSEVHSPNLPPVITPDAVVSFRTWMDKSGAFSVEAKFLRETDDGSIHLEQKGTGRTLKVPIAALSEADRKYVESRRNAKPENPFKPVSP